MKKSQNLLLIKVLFGLVHLLVFGFMLYLYLKSPSDIAGAIPILGLIVAEAFFMQYVIRKDEQTLAS